MPIGRPHQPSQAQDASDQDSAGAYADATVTRLPELAERAGVDLYQAAIEAVTDAPVPELLQRILRSSDTLLGALTETADPALVDQLEALGTAAPPPPASNADRIAWVQTVRQAMRDRIMAAGEDPDVLAALRAGRPLRPGSLSEVSARELLPVMLVLELANISLTSLGGRQAFRRHATDTLAGMLVAAEQGDLRFPTPLQGPAPVDDLVQLLAVAHSAATIALHGRQGTRLRTSLLAREQDRPRAAAAALASELPGAVAVARADIGAAAGSPGTLIDAHRLLARMTTRAAGEVEHAQCVDLDGDAQPWVVGSEPDTAGSGDEWASPTELAAIERLQPDNRLELLTLLTPRQREIIQLTLDGLLEKEIAQSLRIDVRAVRVHKHHAVRKLRAAISPPP
jgi:DNA-binding CsgD family transcriptional regulator